MAGGEGGQVPTLDNGTVQALPWAKRGGLTVSGSPSLSVTRHPEVRRARPSLWSMHPALPTWLLQRPQAWNPRHYRESLSWKGACRMRLGPSFLPGLIPNPRDSQQVVLDEGSWANKDNVVCTMPGCVRVSSYKAPQGEFARPLF